ncbi:MAG TPA: ImmA/IrrE family metallo-endopeptidase [Candidatus Paceibacterota bacterium]|nr:ImmA/IrrE family metallo-endopeptidase [Candidatus Paceibacterota bacterium]
MNIIKVIKTESDYQEALKLLETLMIHDPNPDSAEGEQLALLSTLIEDYEKRYFPSALPSPIDAIKFRMEQADLKPADLIPYLGSPSRVSEILSGKRPLSIEMIRALELGLGIPAKVLIQKPTLDENSEYQNWNNALIAEMEERGYFGSGSVKKMNKVDLLKEFFSQTKFSAQIMGLRKSNYRSSPLTDKHALAAWATRVLKKAKEESTHAPYKPGTVNLDFMQALAKLSIQENGPILAKDYLKKHGITLVIVPHLSKTSLDGMAIMADKKNPIIGLTLRYDRLDNFWFTLMHELAHVALHYDQDIDFFYDELEDPKGSDIGTKEREADKLAGEALVPSDKWEISAAKLVPSSIAANSLAKELGVHVAIVAGKMRHESGKWVYLNSIVGETKVRVLFPDEKSGKKKHVK